MKRGSRLNRILDRVVGIPLLNLLASLRRRHTFPRSVRRIGIFSSPALGDTMLTSAAIQDIRAAFPEAEIVFLSTPQNHLAAQLLPGISRIQTIRITKPWRSIKVVRVLDLDLYIDFSSWQRLTALHALASGARFTVGFRSSGQWRHRVYDLTAEHRSDLHETDNFRALVASMGIKNFHETTLRTESAPLPTEAIGKEIVVFHAWPSGSRSYLREWPEDRWLALAKALSRPGRRFIITGGPSDLDRSRNLVDLLRSSQIDATTYFDPHGLNSLIEVLKVARMVVSVNTGIMHLSAILGAPTICLNGPNSNLRWGPVGPRCVGLDSPGTGCGFLHLGFEFDGNNIDCMERISADDVLQAVLTLWPNAIPGPDSKPHKVVV